MITSNGAEFKQVITGTNVMTPRVLSYWQCGDYQCELSKGTGFINETIYGVTVINTSTMVHENGLSKLFDKRKDALNYIKVLGR